MSGDDPRKGAIAQRLNHLFDTCQPLGRSYTLKEVADGINAAAGQNLLSVQYLSQLRNGDRNEPSYSRLAAIAKFFGVPVSYFSDDETFQRTDDELQALALMRDSGIRSIALRAAGLSPHSLELVTALIERARLLDGLPADEPDTKGVK